MIRQTIGVTSKRRDAEKINLIRDETGRLVMNKMERKTPDYKPLIAARSYMIKMLVEKLFTRKEITGKGKRATAYSNIIS